MEDWKGIVVDDDDGLDAFFVGVIGVAIVGEEEKRGKRIENFKFESRLIDRWSGGETGSFTVSDDKLIQKLPEKNKQSPQWRNGKSKLEINSTKNDGNLKIYFMTREFEKMLIVSYIFCWTKVQRWAM